MALVVAHTAGRSMGIADCSVGIVCRCGVAGVCRRGAAAGAQRSGDRRALPSAERAYQSVDGFTLGRAAATDVLRTLCMLFALEGLDVARLWVQNECGRAHTVCRLCCRGCCLREGEPLCEACLWELVHGQGGVGDAKGVRVCCGCGCLLCGVVGVCGGCVVVGMEVGGQGGGGEVGGRCGGKRGAHVRE